MPCPGCGSKNTQEQVWNETETEEIPNVFIKPMVILCRDCKRGFSCVETIDKRKKDSTNK